MTSFSTYAGGGWISAGDKIRTTGRVGLTAGADTTVVNVASGGGILQEIIIDAPHTISGPGVIYIDTIKVTIDGAAERTLTYGSGSFYIWNAGQISAAGYITLQAFVMRPQISFNTSLTLKINYNKSSVNLDNIGAVGVYTIS